MIKHTMSTSMQPLYEGPDIAADMIHTVVGKKVYNNKTYYRIKWMPHVEFEHQTPISWVIRDSLGHCKEIINNYNKKDREERKMREPVDDKAVEVVVDLSNRSIVSNPAYTHHANNIKRVVPASVHNTPVRHTHHDSRQTDGMVNIFPNYHVPTSTNYPSVIQPTKILDMKGMKYNVMGIMGHFFTQESIYFQVFLSNAVEESNDRVGVVLSLQEMLDFDVNVLQNYLTLTNSPLFHPCIA